MLHTTYSILCLQSRQLSPSQFFDIQPLNGTHVDPQTESHIRVRAVASDAIVREVQTKMAKAVARPKPLRAGGWGIHTYSKGNFFLPLRLRHHLPHRGPFQLNLRPCLPLRPGTSWQLAIH